MDFTLTSEQKMAQQAARDFALQYLTPGVIERDEQQCFPSKEIQKANELGFTAMMVSTDYGGSGLDTVSYSLVIEEIAKVDASVAVILSVNNSLVCWAIETYGTVMQKQKYLSDLASGHLGAFCLSEPEAGSDATAQKTTAIIQKDHYILNGTKNWITNGNSASYYIVIAQSDPSKAHRGINAFIVEKNWEGVVVGPKENKLGIRASDTHTLHFNQVKVPKENRLGKEGFGFTLAMKTLAGGRIGIAAQALGIASGAYLKAKAYSKIRNSFGTAICNHQAIGFKLADMATQIQAAKYLVLKAAMDKDTDKDYNLSSAMAKLHASKTAMDVTIEAVQIHGGNGFVKEYHVERFMRDAKITQIYEGTSEIQKMVIAKAILKQ